MTLFGVDISEHNGVINFDNLKTSVDFVIIRSSWGTTAEDKQFRFNVSECERLMIPYGFYHYSYARNIEEAKAEVEGFLNLIQDYHPTMPLYIDMEDADSWKANNGGVSWEMSTEICRIFCQAIETRGYWAGIYSSRSWFEAMGDLSSYTHWVAEWEVNQPAIPADIWQYSSQEQVAGINGYVDANYMYRDLRFVYQTIPQPSLPSQSPSQTYQVQPGDTLSEIALRFDTTVDDLASKNHIDNPDLIYPGQLLVIA